MLKARQLVPTTWRRAQPKAGRGAYMRSACRAGQSLAGGSALGSPTTADQPATRDGWAHREGSTPKRGVLTHTGLAGTRFLLPQIGRAHV